MNYLHSIYAILYALFALPIMQQSYAGGANSAMQDRPTKKQKISESLEQEVTCKMRKLLYDGDGRIEYPTCSSQDLEQFLKNNELYAEIICTCPELLSRLCIKKEFLDILKNALTNQDDRDTLYPYQITAFLFSRIYKDKKNDSLIDLIKYAINMDKQKFEFNLLHNVIPRLHDDFLKIDKQRDWSYFEYNFEKVTLLHWILRLDLTWILYCFNQEIINNYLYDNGHIFSSFKYFYQEMKDIPTIVGFLEKNPQLDFCESTLTNILEKYFSLLTFEEQDLKKKINQSLENAQKNKKLFNNLLDACKKDDVKEAYNLIRQIELIHNISIDLSKQRVIYQECFNYYSDTTLAKLISSGYLHDLKDDTRFLRFNHSDEVSNLACSGMIKSAKTILQNTPNYTCKKCFGVSFNNLEELSGDNIENLNKNFDRSLLLKLHSKFKLNSNANSNAIQVIRKIALEFPGSIPEYKNLNYLLKLSSDQQSNYIQKLSRYDVMSSCDISGKVLRLNIAIIDSLMNNASYLKCNSQLHRDEIIAQTVKKINSSKNFNWTKYHFLDALRTAYQKPGNDTFKTLKDAGFNISLDKKYVNREKNSIERMLKLLDPQTHDFNFTRDTDFNLNFVYLDNNSH